MNYKKQNIFPPSNKLRNQKIELAPAFTHF